MSHINTLLSIQKLSFKAENKEVLTDISFNINKGELVTIGGPSGSGKSTLLKLIANMIPKSGGAITFKGKKMEDYLPTDYRQTVSYFFQNPVLFGETVRDNFVFPYEIRDKSFDERKAIQLLNEVQLSQEFLNKKIVDLSGGEKQRIAFVRNLLFKPEILLLDEVTSALDETNSQIIRQMITRLNKDEDLTILWVTHNKKEFSSAKRHLLIEEGMLKEDYCE